LTELKSFPGFRFTRKDTRSMVGKDRQIVRSKVPAEKKAG
jgi:hypothetical protein